MDYRNILYSTEGGIARLTMQLDPNATDYQESMGPAECQTGPSCCSIMATRCR